MYQTPPPQIPLKKIQTKNFQIFFLNFSKKIFKKLSPFFKEKNPNVTFFFQGLMVGVDKFVFLIRELGVRGSPLNPYILSRRADPRRNRGESLTSYLGTEKTNFLATIMKPGKKWG